MDFDGQIAGGFLSTRKIIHNQHSLERQEETGLRRATICELAGGQNIGW